MREECKMNQRRFSVSAGREAELFSSAFYRFLERELQSLSQADHCSLHAEPGLEGDHELMTVELWDVAAVERFDFYWRDFRREHLVRLGRLRETLSPRAAAARTAAASHSIAAA
jgi:hypothetical protein